jgi:ABC-type glycerol-3-phosphate transport system substrate-binding protein
VKAVGGSTDGFIAGKLSIGTYGDWTFATFIKKSQGADWDATFIPRSPRTKKTGSMADFQGLVMNPATRQAEAGWELMKFMLTKPVQDRVTALFQEVPARTDSATEIYADPQKSGPPAGRKLLKESIQATRALPAHYNAPLTEYRPQVSAIVTDVLNGKVGVRDGLKQAEDFANNVFANYAR